MCKANVALAAVRGALLAEILKQLTAAANVVVLGILRDGVYALNVLALAVVVNVLAEHQPLRRLTALHVADVGNGLAGNEAQDVAAVKLLKNVVHLIAVNARLA